MSILTSSINSITFTTIYFLLLLYIALLENLFTFNRVHYKQRIAIKEIKVHPSLDIEGYVYLTLNNNFITSTYSIFIIGLITKKNFLYQP